MTELSEKKNQKREKQKREKDMVMRKSLSVGEKQNSLEYNNGKDGKSYWCKAHSTDAGQPQAFQL